jgi:hypothetical protein
VVEAAAMPAPRGPAPRPGGEGGERCEGREGRVL